MTTTKTTRPFVPVRVHPVRAAIVQAKKVWSLRLLIGAGLLALLHFFGWWGEALRLTPVLALLMLPVLGYILAQFLGSWLLYLVASPTPPVPPPPDALTVDVFVPVCGEPLPLVEQALAAAVAMRGPHRTWLLDDGADPEMAALAARVGAGYLARSDRCHAKAGNVNAALAQTSGDVIAIFDVDHVPAPDFLERTLGHFVDAAVGFVQVMVTFRNGPDSWVARAATETSLDFYYSSSLGMEQLRGTTMMGSNALIRREALVSIGGYRPGLAEDLATSLALHEAGWASIYVPEPLAPGLSPGDLLAWFTQQLKWSRGVFELLLVALPRLFARLTRGQQLSYLVRMTKYGIGPLIAIHLVATVVALLANDPSWQAMFHRYLLHAGPLVLADLLIRALALRLFSPRTAAPASLWRAASLVYSTWFAYSLAGGMALLRVPLAFHLTPKSSAGRLHPVWLLPNIVMSGLLALGLALALSGPASGPSLLLVGFAAFQLVLQLALPWQWLTQQ